MTTTKRNASLLITGGDNNPDWKSMETLQARIAANRAQIGKT